MRLNTDGAVPRGTVELLSHWFGQRGDADVGLTSRDLAQPLVDMLGGLLSFSKGRDINHVVSRYSDSRVGVDQKL